MNEVCAKLEAEKAAHVCPDPRMPGAWPDDDHNSASNADDASEPNMDTDDGANPDAETEDPDEGVNPPPVGWTHSMLVAHMLLETLHLLIVALPERPRLDPRGREIQRSLTHLLPTRTAGPEVEVNPHRILLHHRRL